MHEDYKSIGKPEDRVIEECAELTKAIIKAKRFKLNEKHPKKDITNREQILLEIQDVRRTMDELEQELTLKTKEMQYCWHCKMPIFKEGCSCTGIDND